MSSLPGSGNGPERGLTNNKGANATHHIGGGTMKEINSEDMTRRKKYWNARCPAWIAFLKVTGIPEEDLYPEVNEGPRPIPLS